MAKVTLIGTFLLSVSACGLAALALYQTRIEGDAAQPRQPVATERVLEDERVDRLQGEIDELRRILSTLGQDAARTEERPELDAETAAFKDEHERLLLDRESLRSEIAEQSQQNPVQSRERRMTYIRETLRPQLAVIEARIKEVEKELLPVDARIAALEDERERLLLDRRTAEERQREYMQKGNESSRAADGMEQMYRDVRKGWTEALKRINARIKEIEDRLMQLRSRRTP